MGTTYLAPAQRKMSSAGHWAVYLSFTIYMGGYTSHVENRGHRNSTNG